MSSETLLSSVPYDLEPEELKEYFQAFHRAAHQRKQAVLNEMLKAPESFMDQYLQYCKQHYCEAGVANLHFLLSHPKFPYRDKILNTLEVVRSPRSIDFLYHYSTNTTLYIKKKILKVLVSFPQAKPHPVLLQYLDQEEVELKHLALQIILHLESFKNTESLEKQLSSPFPEIRKLALKALYRFEGSCWFQKKVNHLKELEPRLQNLLIDQAQEFKLSLNVENTLMHCEEFSPEILIKIMKLVPSDLSPSGQELLLSLLNHEEKDVRLETILALSKNPLVSKSIKALVERLETESNPRMLEGIFQCFSNLEEGQKLDLFIKLADQHLEKLSSFLISEFQNRRHLPRVLEMIRGYLKDPCSVKAAFALHLIEDPEPYEQEIEILVKSPRKPIQSRARELMKILERRDLDNVFQEAKTLFEKRDFPQVRWTLDTYLQERPSDPQGLLLYAQAQAGDENMQGAIQSLKTLLKTSPDHVPALKLLGSLYLDQSEAREAAPLLKKAAYLSTNDPLLMEYLFLCYLQLNEISHALQVFEKIPTQFTRHELCEKFFQAALDSKEYGSIITHFPRYLQLCGESRPVIEPHCSSQTSYGIALFLSGRKQEADQVFDAVISTFSKSVEHLDCLRKISKTTKKKAHLEAYLEGACGTHPEDQSHISNLLEFYSHHSPERCLEKMDTLDPRGDFLKIKAKTLRKLGKYDESSEIFESLFLQNSSDETIPFELGLNYFEKNQFKKALKYFQYYAKHQSQPNRLHYYLSLCYARLGYRDLSSKHLVFSLQVKPADIQAWLLFVESLSLGNPPEELMEFLSEASEVLHQHPSGLKKLGSFYLSRKDPLASRVFERVAQLLPEDGEVHLILANHFFEAKKYSKAFSHYQRIREELPAEQLERFSLCAQRSLNYADAFTLYLKLYENEKNREFLNPRLHELISQKDSFYHICEHTQPEIIRKYAKFLDDFPLFTYKLGGKFFREGKLNSARASFERLKKVHNAYLRSDFFLGMISIHQEKREESRTHLENALLHEDPKPVQIYSILGEVSFDLEDWERAKHCYIKIFQSGKKTEDALEYLYQIYSKEGHLQKFLHLATKGPERLLRTERIRYLAGKANMELGNFEEAFQLFTELPSSSPFQNQAEFMGALCLMKQKKYKEASLKFKELEPVQESLEDFSFHYGTCLKELQRFPSAIEQFSLALEFQQNTYQAYLHLIDTHLKCMRPDEALPHLLQACAIKFPFAECYRVCKALYSQGRYEEMERIYDRCHEEVFDSPSDSRKSSIIQGFLLTFYNQQNPVKLDHCTRQSVKSDPSLLKEFLSQKSLSSGFRFEVLKRVCELLPEEPAFPFHLGRFYFSANRIPTARQYLETALELMKNTQGNEGLAFETLKDLATITYESRELEQCLEYLELAVSIKPDHVEVLEKLSYVYGLKEEIDQQAKIDQKLFFLKSDNALVSKRLYTWFEKHSDLQNSIFHLKNYLKENSSDVEKIQHLAKLSNQAGMHTQEVQAYQMLENLGVELPVGHFLNVGQAYLALNREEKAAESFQKYLAKNPGNQGLQFQLGMIYKNQGYLKKAVFTFREILRSDRANTTVRYELSDALFEDRNLDEARANLEELLTIKPYHIKARELLAKIHYRRGENRNAMEILDQLLKGNPENVQARLMQARLFRSEGMLEEACQNYEELFRSTRSDEYLLELGVLNLKLNRKHTAMKHLRQLAQSSESKSRFTRMAKSLLKKESLG